MPNLLIEVTQEDIDKGDRAQPHSCAVARAVKRATRRQKVKIGYRCSENAKGDHIDIPYVIIDKDDYEHDLPGKVKTFIENFDGHRRVKPFSFQLRGYQRSN